VIDTGGQRVSAEDRLYLAGDVPSMIVWGEGDRIIPVEHAYAAHEMLPESRLEILPGSGHFLFNDDPDLFVSLLREFMAGTEPAVMNEEHVRRMLQERGNLDVVGKPGI
jgi:pimeloyl-ACP methyl ester carboxylesterase